MDAEEYVSAYQECSTVLSSNNDCEFKALEDIKAMWSERVYSYCAKEADIKKSIEALAGNCDKAEKELSQQEAANDSERVEQLTAQLEQNIQRKGDVESDLCKLREEQESVKLELEELEHRQDELRDSTTRVLPTIRHDVNIYQHVSGIRWQNDCQAHEVKGYMCHQNKVKTFSLDRQKNSQFFIANYLWDQMEADW